MGINANKSKKMCVTKVTQRRLNTEWVGVRKDGWRRVQKANQVHYQINKKLEGNQQ